MTPSYLSCANTALPPMRQVIKKRVADDHSCDVCRIQGFPTIKAFVNGRVIDYNGDRSAGHLKDWAISLIPQKVSLSGGSSSHIRSVSSSGIGVCGSL